MSSFRSTILLVLFSEMRWYLRLRVVLLQEVLCSLGIFLNLEGTQNPPLCQEKKRAQFCAEWW